MNLIGRGQHVTLFTTLLAATPALVLLCGFSAESRPAGGASTLHAAPAPFVAVSHVDDAAPEAASQPASRPARPKIIPWIEVNTSDDAPIAAAVRGLLIWQRITDVAIVSTAPGHDDVYHKIRARTPGLRIIPGVKTADLLRPLDSPAAWKRVAREVRRMCAAAGENCCVLENETALYSKTDASKNFWAGNVRVDYEQLRAGLRELPRDVEIWFYPSFVTGTALRDAYHQQSERLCQAVQDSLNVRFIDYEFAKPTGRNDWWDNDLATMRARIAKSPSIHIVYFTPGGKYWDDRDAPRILDAISATEVIFYSGATRWVESAEKISTLLKP